MLQSRYLGNVGWREQRAKWYFGNVHNRRKHMPNVTLYPSRQHHRPYTCPSLFPKPGKKPMVACPQGSGEGEVQSRGRREHHSSLFPLGQGRCSTSVAPTKAPSPALSSCLEFAAWKEKGEGASSGEGIPQFLLFPVSLSPGSCEPMAGPNGRLGPVSGPAREAKQGLRPEKGWALTGICRLRGGVKGNLGYL